MQMLGHPRGKDGRAEQNHPYPGLREDRKLPPRMYVPKPQATRSPFMRSAHHAQNSLGLSPKPVAQLAKWYGSASPAQVRSLRSQMLVVEPEKKGLLLQRLIDGTSALCEVSQLPRLAFSRFLLSLRCPACCCLRNSANCIRQAPIHHLLAKRQTPIPAEFLNGDFLLPAARPWLPNRPVEASPTRLRA